MSGLIASLSTGTSGLLTSQKAIEVTGGNIANVNTPGYSRQAPVLASFPSLNIGGISIGQGVRIDDLDRQRDLFMDRQIQSKLGSFGEEDAKTVPLTDLERIMDISDEGLGGEISRFFDALQDVSSDPSRSVTRQLVITQGEALANAFNTVEAELQSAREGINLTLESKVDDVNSKLKTIAELNVTISGISAAGQTAAGAMDQRDQLIEEVGKILGSQSLASTGGMVSLMLPGGLPLVQDGDSMQLESYRVGGDVQFRLKTGSGSSIDLASAQMGGEFKGLMEVRDGQIPELRDDLDNLAFTLASQINAQHRAGRGLDNSTNNDFFSIPATASGAARAIAVALTDGNQFAAGTTSEPGDNNNVLAMIGLAEQELVNGQDRFSDFYAKMAARIGTDVRQNNLKLTGIEDAMSLLEKSRASVSGVSLEEEMINMIKFQKTFEASAKMLSVIDEMMDTVLSVKR